MSRRHPRLLIVLLTVLFMTVTIKLGLWQLHKGQHKTVLMAQLAERSLVPPAPWRGQTGVESWQRRYQVQGIWYAAGQILLDNRVHGDTAGYDVLTPLSLNDGQLLLVYRGWFPRPVSGQLVPPAPPAGMVSLLIQLADPAQHYFQLSQQPPAGVVWQNLDWVRYGNLLRRPIVKVIAYQLDTRPNLGRQGSDGLIRDWPAAGLDAERNYGYAGQWFLFAGLALVLFIVMHWKARTP